MHFPMDGDAKIKNKQQTLNDHVYLGIPSAVRLQTLATGYTERIMKQFVL